MPSADALLLLILATPFAAALAAACLPRHARNVAAWLATGATLACLALAAALFGEVAGGGVVRTSLPWAPSLGLTFGLRADGFTWLFLMLISGIGFLVSIYARYYMSASDPVPRFFSLLLAFAGAMMGIVLSSNVIQLVVFWEMTSVLSFLLIGYWHNGVAAREGARMSLVVTSAGGLALLVGMLLLGHIAGSYEIDDILAAGDEVRASALYGPTLILILLGAFTKSAQFPFHFWLPQAMAAPTPVSAFLHSATMVKAGVFLLVRFWPVLSGTEAWFWVVGVAGLTTLTLGAFVAIFQRDMKGVLAYSTLSHLGLITFLLGLSSPLACVAAIFHIVNHAVFKASLFMAAGAVDHETGTRDLRKLGGLARHMPITAALATISAAAMAGVPLLNGFLSKEMFFEETLAARPGGGLIGVLPTLVAVSAGAFAVIYSLRFLGGVFYGPPQGPLPRPAHEPPLWMVAPIGLLALTCVAVGTLPGRTIGPYLGAAAASVLGPRTPDYSLAVWHGLTPALMMSGLALAAGIGGYVLLRPRLRAGRGTPVVGRISGKRLFEAGLTLTTERLPGWVERRFPSERLQPQLLFVALAALAAAALAFGTAPLSFKADLSSIDPPFALLWLIGGACAIAAARAAKFHRLAALAAAGGAGLMSCISFVWLSAPDLAATQLLVEVVTTILILLGLRWLPARIEMRAPGGLPTRLRRARDLLVALAAGGGMAVLAYGVMMHPVDDSVSQFFLGAAYDQGGGRNVVNVILVDFRGFDTLGEITVLGIVALSVFALLRRFRPGVESVGPPVQQKLQAAFDDAHPARDKGQMLAEFMNVPGLITQLMFPIILVFAIHLFLRGHDLPGGGFAAGLTASAGLILLYMARGVRWVESRFRVAPIRWIALGLLTALGTGLGSLVFGYPFLTSHFQYVELPVVGKLPLPTAMLFDLGVFILVVGATTLILTAIAHQSLRRPRRGTSAQSETEPGGAA